MDVTIILDLISSLSDVRPYSVSVTIVPSDSVAAVITNNTHAELTLLYNTRYNISFNSAFCGLTDESNTIQLFYGKLNNKSILYYCTTVCKYIKGG
jgi:hypothetical protein